jgi:hypothetical protein
MLTIGLAITPIILNTTAVLCCATRFTMRTRGMSNTKSQINKYELILDIGGFLYKDLLQHIQWFVNQT